MDWLRYVLWIVDMDDVVRISRSLYAVLCKIIGSDEEVYIRRTATNLRDDIIRMEKEWTNEDSFPCYSGSKAEGLRFKSSDEDWMFVYRNIKVVPPHSYTTLYDINTELLMMDDGITKPGFTLLRMLEKDNHLVFKYLNESYLTVTVTMLNGCYLSSKLWREGLAQSRKHLHTVFLHGPCTSGFIENQEYDWAHCLKCDVWPENARSSIQTLYKCSWPSKDILQAMVSDGVLFVPIGAKQSPFEHIEWRISFSLAEKRMIHSMNHTQFLCYGLLKLFLKEAIDTNEDVKGLLCSYFLKTALFWEITTSPNQWNASSLLSCFWKCFRRILQWVRSSYCPNFFIPENNMFQGKIEGENREKLFQHLCTLYSEGFMCLSRCSSLISHNMSEVLSGSAYLVKCNCRVCTTCMAVTITHEDKGTNPLGCHCFSLNDDVVCLLLYHFMHTADNTLDHFFASRWFHESLSKICMSKAIQLPACGVCNKSHYRNHVCRLRALNRCRIDPICHYVYQAVTCYNMGKYNQTLRLVDRAHEVVFSRGLIYKHNDTRAQRMMVFGTKLPLETVLRKSVIDLPRLYHNLIPELYIETCRIKGIQNIRAISSIPIVIFVFFQQYICYNKLGNRQKREESLNRLSLIMHNDDHHHIFRHTICTAWLILGICQQMSGDYWAAFHSYCKARHLDKLDFHESATCIRLGIVLAKFFWLISIHIKS